MKIESYNRFVESRRIRRETIWVMLLNAVLVAMIAAGLYVTFTAFGQTELREGLRNFIAWIGGAR